MTVNVGLQVGNELGLLSGNKKEFHTYSEMVEFLKSDEWVSQKHKDGQYLINNNTIGHTVICNGFKKDKLLFTDSENTRKEMDESSGGSYGFTLMY